MICYALCLALQATPVPTPEKPVRQRDTAAREAIRKEFDEILKLPAEQVKAHPAAASFPGAVPAEAPRVTRKVTIDAAVPGWHSTGLYAAPGEVIAVVVPETADLRLRIGAHRDTLWKLDRWNRHPEVARRWPVKGAETRVAGAFGGPVYLESSGTGAVVVEIRNAVEAPRFVLGRTTAAEWKLRIRDLAAPWAELETRKIILTVPSRVVKALDDPAPLLEFWDRVMDGLADIVGIPRERPRPERIVADVQISAGWMHSGYPIMTHLRGVAEELVDLEKLRTWGSDNVWGFYHELGHNHQASPWTFSGTGEVTNNVLVLYVLDQVCKLGPRAFERPGKECPPERIRKHLAEGAPFEKWKADPWLALASYVQLYEGFGWEPFRKVFAEYRTGALPKNDDEKRDQWMIRFSKAVGRNLGPFYQAWGVPTSVAARKSVESLPDWMPLSVSARPPLIVAHRGASRDAPENTLAAFRLALEKKADVIETDLHLTKDGRIVLLHDADTKRTAGAPGHKVAETSSDVLRALDVGRGKDPKFAGERIPFLEELLDLVPRDRGLFPEIKCKQEILPALEAVLRKSGKLRQITLIGFDLEVMAAAKARLPEVAACWLRGTEKDPKTKKPFPHRLEWIASAKEKKLDGLDVNYEGLTADFAKAVKASGLALHVWTVNDPAEARRVAALGVDSITTDQPDVIRKALAD